VTTISPNGDNLRESAKIGFTLDEPAQAYRGDAHAQLAGDDLSSGRT
jgi:hypothetical protein